MALIDDIEFYGRVVDAGDLPRGQAAELLARDSRGGLTVHGAGRAIDDWEGMRHRMGRLHADVVDTLRALGNGRPTPEHVHRHNRERARENTLRTLQRMNRDAGWWEETPAEAARLDRYWFDR